MSGNMSKADKEKQKLLQEKCQTALNIMLRDEDNKYCVDCDAKGPRWASWNLGIFLCIRCAGIHRNLGVHISKVKSVNLDSWTPEQVVSMQQMGNSRGRAVYEANLPDSFRRPQNDSALEQFVRAKYEHKKYIAREYVPTPLPRVDWEGEIEADLRRKKDKKRGDATPPPLRVEPPPSKVTLPDKVPTPPSKQKAKPVEAMNKAAASSDDLLGLDIGTTPASTSTSKPSTLEDDIFGVFVNANNSAPPQPPPQAVPSIQDEENSFFNQSQGEKKPMDKNSILALYGKSGPQMNSMFAQPAQAAMPQGVFGYATPNMIPNQGVFGMPASQIQQQQQPFGLMGMNGQFAASGNPQSQPSAFAGFPAPAMGPNPFMQNQLAQRPSELMWDFNRQVEELYRKESAANQLQNQMSGISMGNGNPGVSQFGNGLNFQNGTPSQVQQTNGQTLSNILWQ